MHKWKRSSWLTILVLAVLLLTVSSSARVSLPVTVAQGDADLQVALDVQINVMPHEAYLPLTVRNHIVDGPRTLTVRTGSNAYARAGSWLRYVVTYGNTGSGPSAPVEIVLTLPGEVRYCVECDQAWVPVGDHQYELTGDPLAPGEQRTAILAAQVGEFQDPGVGELSSQVVLSGEAMSTEVITIAATFTTGPTHANPVGVAVDPARNVVYTAIHSTGEVAEIDVSGSIITYHPTGGTSAQGIVYLNGRVYVANPDQDQVSVLDTTSWNLVASIPVGDQPFGVAAAGSRVYVSNFAGDSVTVIDATSLGVIATAATGGDPCLIGALDDRAYVANHSHLTGTLAISGDPTVLRAQAEQYAQQHPDETGVTVVYPDGTTERILTGEIGFFGVAVDATRNRVYVTQRDLGHEGLYVLDGTDHHLIRHVPLSKPYAVAVNPTTNHVFVVMAQPEVNQLYVFDGDNDYALIRTEDLPQQSLADGMMNGGQGVAVMNDWVYVADYGVHSMTSFPDTPAVQAEFDPPIGAPFVRAWLYDLPQPGHRPAGLPVGQTEYRPFAQQEFEHGFVGGVTQDVLYLRDAISGTDHIYEFKAFIGGTSAPVAQTLLLNTDSEVSVGFNSARDEKVAYDSTEDGLRFGNYLAPGAEPSFFRTYLRFPLGSIPGGSTIHSAVLQMWVFDERLSGTSLDAGIYRVTTGGWSEPGLKDTSTWTWPTLPGFAPAPQASQSIAALEQWYYWDVTALVQDWVNSSAPNYGLMVSGNPESGVAQAMGARSRAGAYPDRGPVLVVRYTPSAPSFTTPGYDGTRGYWLQFDDTWSASQPEYACSDGAPGDLHDYGIRYGFGVVWCTLRFSTDPAFEHYKLGWPLSDEHYGLAASQRFQNGILFWSPDGDYPNLSGRVYAAYNEGWWRSYPY